MKHFDAPQTELPHQVRASQVNTNNLQVLNNGSQVGAQKPTAAQLDDVLQELDAQLGGAEDVQQLGSSAAARKQPRQQKLQQPQNTPPQPQTKAPQPKAQPKNVEDLLEDMLQDLDALPPPPPVLPAGGSRFEKPYYKNLAQVLALLYAVSANDASFASKSVDKQTVAESFRACEALKRSKLGTATQLRVGKLFEIQLIAIRYAIKIAFDLYSINGTLDGVTDEELLEEIRDNQKNSYIGQGTDPAWAEQINNNIANLWSLQFNAHDRTLSVFRSFYKQIKCTLFEFNEDVVAGIWANLQFELYYVTNDDDERYSIQTHKNFMRNIIIESAENPLGYAPFYSGPVSIPS